MWQPFLPLALLQAENAVRYNIGNSVVLRVSFCMQLAETNPIYRVRAVRGLIVLIVP